ncbi:FAD-dependent oxidoreductase [Rhodococcus hoagii]|uniref:Pyridine nucleotide-disulfide oxidoreductase domain-containing protein 2 n=1 Tax=Rhodococcus hoagii (strain 103S) TaxID=685727 RepID=A0A3S5Y7S0_RHOH1|nr:NAD(P)/FAD-dependent oxidoreductase [Prescottella equi]NKR86772.1 FAD-dependent oxidoreductase [Prescottella equi]NKS09352.1 FAD-dependent oxidoreductase [Prescottella equi]NKS91669.1 FAD-dependent oxidoreductase [Prescottella equi]NKT09015.1 FAD-dependent oxidoreductase [Prescottella equi]NKT19226.1 FAD-dependent oxidoreductase [Prescottella equi]
MTEKADAIVVGAGPNGLVAAITLADRGWDVLVLEAEPTPGGAVRSGDLHPGYRYDRFSAFYPLSAVSPAFAELDLDRYGLSWSRAPIAVAHPLDAEDSNAPAVLPEAADTAAALERFRSGDGERWLELYRTWERIREPLLDTLFGPFPPLKGPVKLLRELGSAEALRIARFLLLPANRMGQELFAGEAAKVLLLGNALHADVPPDAPISGAMGFLLGMLAQDVGFPVPVGGAGALTDALVRRLESAGGRVECDSRVDAVTVQGGAATGVRLSDGRTFGARRAVLADVSAPALYERLLPQDVVPANVRAALANFEWDTPVVKVNYALREPIPWQADSVRRAGTVHVGGDTTRLAKWHTQLAAGELPEHPFLLVGQMTTADPSRSPDGTESAWAYTHLPRGVADDASADKIAEHTDEQLERFAPGFGSNIVARSVQRPSDLERADANLVNGAVNGGTAQLHQQLIFRPVPGSSRPETPVKNLFLASASAHPGGGVHGVCGLNAARAALARHGIGAPVRRSVNRVVADVVWRSAKRG